jgi:hypothetical protein
VSYPVWIWRWATPAGAQVRWPRARRISFSPRAMKRRVLAVDCFGSQIRPLSPTESATVPLNHLAYSLRYFEMVFV